MSMTSFDCFKNVAHPVKKFEGFVVSSLNVVET